MNKYPPTLKIKLPVGYLLLLAILFVALFWGICEAVLRIAVTVGVSAVPSVGTSMAQFNMKLTMLDQYAKLNGRVDCIFLGSSQLDNALNPVDFSAEYEKLSGKHTVCFNFALPTLTASPADKITALLIQRYHPRLIVYGTSARDYTWNYGEMARPLLDDPWIQYQEGVFSLQGWLFDNSYAIRELVNFRRMLVPEYFDYVQRVKGLLTPEGYTYTKMNDVVPSTKIFVEEYIRSKQDLLGLENLVKIQSPQVKIVFLEVPVHPSFMPYYIEKGEESYRKLFLEPVSNYVRAGGVPFIQSQDAMKSMVPPTGWADLRHLNAEGGTIYSRWVAKQIFAAISHEEMEDPFK